MADTITTRWRDPEGETVHELTAHGARNNRYDSAITACGLALTGLIVPCFDEVDCEACISAGGDDALQEAERILARGLLREPVAA